MQLVSVWMPTAFSYSPYIYPSAAFFFSHVSTLMHLNARQAQEKQPPQARATMDNKNNPQSKSHSREQP